MSSQRFCMRLVAFGVLLGSAVGFGNAAVQDQEESKAPSGKFVAPGQVLNIPKTVPTLSGDGVVVTHKFEDIMVEVGGKRGFPEADSLSASVRSTLAEHEEPVYVRQILKGHADLQPGVEAAVLFQSCGKTTLVPLPKSGYGEFEVEVVGAVESGPDYLATVCILVQRSSRDHEVKGLVVVDNLELTIVDSPKDCE